VLLSSFFSEKPFEKLTKVMTNAPKRTQSKIRMIKGNLNWTKRKFTVTDCMFAREIPAINKIKSNKAM
jgi:hypothetical protein